MYHVKSGNLERSFQNLSADIAMCYQCEAGVREYPYEDVSRTAAWRATINICRPWSRAPQLARIPFNERKPETCFKRDIFHTDKQGMGRMGCACIIVDLAQMDYFTGEGGIYNLFVLL